MPTDLMESRIVSKKKLDLKPNPIGFLKMNKNYLLLKDRADYATLIKAKYPEAKRYTGVTAGAVFTPTASPVWTVDELKDKWVMCYKAADVTTLNTEDLYSTIANISHDIRKVLSNTATAVTMRTGITAGMTDIIVIDKLWQPVGQLTEFNFEPTSNSIEANDADSGGYMISIDGLKDVSISGITGNFFPHIHTLHQLQHAQVISKAVEFRTYATSEEGDIVTMSQYKLTKFTPTGAPTGDDKLAYSGEATNAGTPSVKTVMVTGTIPDFM